MRAYPRRFREHYGSEMIELFAMRYDRAGSLTSRLALWMGTAWDVLWGGISLRIAGVVRRQRYVGVGAAARVVAVLALVHLDLFPGDLVEVRVAGGQSQG